MKLYWGSGSPVSWRVQLALALKGIDYTSHRLDLGAREHRGDAYLAINAKGTFPVVVDGDLVVRESMAILAYLERKHPEPPLFGDTPATCATGWQLALEHDAGLGADADVITRALFRNGGLDGEEAVTRARDAVTRAVSALGELNETLEGAEWLMGSKPSVADVVNYPTWHRLRRAAGKPRAAEVQLSEEMLRAEVPGVVAWAERLAAVPGVDETYPPHWRA